MRPLSAARVATLLCAFVIAMAMMVLLGWVFDVRVLKSVLPYWTTMKSNTAVCLLLTAVALLLSRTREESRRYRPWIGLLLLVVALFAALTLAENFFHWDAGIDQLLFRDLEHVGTSYPPGRFAPGTALGLLLLVIALWLIDSLPRFSQALTLGAMLVALVALLGYLYGLPSLYGASLYPALAVHTVLGFLLLAVGILCARPERGLLSLVRSPSPTAATTRPLLAGAIGLPVLLGWICLEGQRLGWYGGEFTLALFTVLLIVTTVGLVWRTNASHLIAELRRRDAEDALQKSHDLLRRLNEDLEQRVEQRTTELAQANRELEAFSYSVSHDLRAPLRSMDSFSRFLLDDYGDKLDFEGRQYLERIRINAQRMGQLISDLLNLARVSRTALRREPVDASALVRGILQELQQRHPERTVETVVAPGVVLDADPVLLRVALVNLLENAWKFTAHAEPARIEFAIINGQGTPVLCVRDNGAGFDMAHAGHLFVPFQRLHQPNEFEGTGIGLATVQRVVSRHGGRVWVDAAVNQGAAFYFTLDAETGIQARGQRA